MLLPRRTRRPPPGFDRVGIDRFVGRGRRFPWRPSSSSASSLRLRPSCPAVGCCASAPDAAGRLRDRERRLTPTGIERRRVPIVMPSRHAQSAQRARPPRPPRRPRPSPPARVRNSSAASATADGSSTTIATSRRKSRLSAASARLPTTAVRVVDEHDLAVRLQSAEPLRRRRPRPSAPRRAARSAARRDRDPTASRRSAGCSCAPARSAR